MPAAAAAAAGSEPSMWTWVMMMCQGRLTNFHPPGQESRAGHGDAMQGPGVYIGSYLFSAQLCHEPNLLLKVILKKGP